MKKLLALAIGLITFQLTFSQSGEFKQYPNGLIYSESTMSKLAGIVDSLNLKYKYCDLNKTYHAKAQTIGHSVYLDTGDIKQAKIAMEDGMTLEEFKTHFPEANIKENILVVRFQYKGYDDQDEIQFREVGMEGYYGAAITKDDNLDDFSGKLKHRWVYDYTPKSDYSEESILAFYFPKDLESAPIPEKYARMIGYADCLVDTNATKFKEDMKPGWVDLPKRWEKFSFNKKEKLLDEMRSTRVIGGCSMDTRPRTHAVNIAMLSAETANWEVFLRAHLDVMNDRFERMSDGSYAWGDRKTYIRELEELNINVSDLILGICLRVENPATNHYFGSIRRVGRALAETQNRAEIEQQLVSMIEDKELDDYNRIMAYFLFENYLYHTEDEALKVASMNTLKGAVETLPQYVRERISLD